MYGCDEDADCEQFGLYHICRVMYALPSPSKIKKRMEKVGKIGKIVESDLNYEWKTKHGIGAKVCTTRTWLNALRPYYLTILKARKVLSIASLNDPDYFDVRFLEFQKNTRFH